MRLSVHRLVFLLCLAGASAVRAASVYTEGFGGGMSGWTNYDLYAWQATNGYAQVRFGGSGLPLPSEVTLLASNNASGGAFSGNYLAAGIGVVGFRFMAVSALPTDLLFQWQRGTSYYSRLLTPGIASTGVWYQFVLSLAGKDEGGWSGSPASEFTNALAAVDQIRLNLKVTLSASPTFYRLDDFFTDRPPAAVAVANPDGPPASVTWTYLRTNLTYRVQVADAPANAWSNLVAFTATNRTQEVSVTNAPPDPYGFFRLRNASP